MNIDSDPDVAWNAESESSEFSCTAYSSNLKNGWSNIHLERHYKVSVIIFFTYQLWLKVHNSMLFILHTPDQ